MLLKIGNPMFIPKIPEISVGGINNSETNVRTFIILFWSKLIRPSTVFCRYSNLSKLKFVWFNREAISFTSTLSLV